MYGHIIKRFAGKKKKQKRQNKKVGKSNMKKSLVYFLLQFILALAILVLKLNYYIQILILILIFCMWVLAEKTFVELNETKKFLKYYWIFIITVGFIAPFIPLLSKSSYTLLISFLCLEYTYLKIK